MKGRAGAPQTDLFAPRVSWAAPRRPGLAPGRPASARADMAEAQCAVPRPKTDGSNWEPTVLGEKANFTVDCVDVLCAGGELERPFAPNGVFCRVISKKTETRQLVRGARPPLVHFGPLLLRRGGDGSPPQVSPLQGKTSSAARGAAPVPTALEWPRAATAARTVPWVRRARRARLRAPGVPLFGRGGAGADEHRPAAVQLPVATNDFPSNWVLEMATTTMRARVPEQAPRGFRGRGPRRRPGRLFRWRCARVRRADVAAVRALARSGSRSATPSRGADGALGPTRALCPGDAVSIGARRDAAPPVARRPQRVADQRPGARRRPRRGGRGAEHVPGRDALNPSFRAFAGSTSDRDRRARGIWRRMPSHAGCPAST